MFYPNSNRSKRWDAIRQTMEAWREGRTEPAAYNNSLRGYITVNHRISTKETPYWGSKNPESAALICGHFNEILRYAVKKEEVVPHSNKGNQFAKLIILERTVKDKGTAKLTVGVKPDDTLVQYCITAANAVATA